MSVIDRDVVLSGNGMEYRVLSTVDGDAERRGSYVLVHGLGTSHRYMARLHTELSRTADVYSIDLPGFGGLDKPTESPTVEEYARGIADVLDELGVSDAVLAGHSMGSQWVVELAVQRADLARAVVAIGPVTDDRRRTLIAQSFALARDIAGEPPLTNALVFADYLRCGTIWFLREARHMIDYRIDLRASLLTRPLLIVRGGNDPIATLEWSRRLRDSASDASLVIIPGHRHVVQFTSPRAVASAIRAFVARKERAAT